MDKKRILHKVSRRMYENRPRNKDFAAFDDIDELKWQIPFNAQPWVRKRVSSVGHNGLKTVLNMFNTYNPKWEILPRGPADAEYAEELERWLEWQMEQTNTKGAQEPFRQMLKSSAKRGMIAAQLEYLPYWLTEDSEERKALLMNGSFCINVHEEDAADIHYEIGKYDLRWVAQVSCVTSAYIMDIWEQYESGDDNIKRALKRVRDKVEGETEEIKFLYVDYTDKDSRWVVCKQYDKYPTFETVLELVGDTDVIELLNTKNELPFINWVVTEATGDPLFYSMHKSGSWENDNFFLTLSDSTVLRRAYFPLLKHTSATGDDVEIDFSGPEAVAKVRAGDQLEQMQPPPLDPGIREMMDRNTQGMSGDLGVRGLQNTDITGNVAFSSVNAQIQLGKTVLDPYIRAFERACVNLAKLAFRWVKYSGDSVTAYREKTTGDKARGQKINVDGTKYDPNTLMIECELLANTPTDDMQRWNIFSGMMQAGLPVPKSEFVERLELGDPEVLKQRSIEEKIEEFAIQLFMEGKRAEQQMKIQNAAQEAQQAAMAAAAQQAQGQAPPQQGVDQPAFDQTQGQGYDPSRQGSSPAEAAPQLTREQIG